jgi:hypothetical protein
MARRFGAAVPVLFATLLAGAVVSLAADRISVDGFGREPDRTITLPRPGRLD